MHTHIYMIIHADVICATYEDLYAQKAAVICKLSIYVNDAHTHTPCTCAHVHVGTHTQLLSIHQFGCKISNVVCTPIYHQ